MIPMDVSRELRVNVFRNPILSARAPQTINPILWKTEYTDTINPASEWDIPSVFSIVTNRIGKIVILMSKIIWVRNPPVAIIQP